MLLKTARRLVVIVVGFTVVLIGIALIVLPGPAFIVIPAGLAILGTEFLWAKRLMNRMRHKANAMLGRFEPVICSNCASDLVGRALKEGEPCPECNAPVPPDTVHKAAQAVRDRVSDKRV